MNLVCYHWRIGQVKRSSSMEIARFVECSHAFTYCILSLAHTIYTDWRAQAQLISPTIMGPGFLPPVAYKMAWTCLAHAIADH